MGVSSSIDRVGVVESVVTCVGRDIEVDGASVLRRSNINDDIMYGLASRV